VFATNRLGFWNPLNINFAILFFVDLPGADYFEYSSTISCSFI